MIIKKNDPKYNKQCCVFDCENKIYGRDYLNAFVYSNVCRKHYYEFNYGIVKGLSDN